jgi:hypothetical protein
MDPWQRLPTDVVAIIWRLRFRGMLEDRLARLTWAGGAFNRSPDIGKVMQLQSKLLAGSTADDDWQATEAHRQLQMFYDFYEAWLRYYE